MAADLHRTSIGIGNADRDSFTPFIERNIALCTDDLTGNTDLCIILHFLRNRQKTSIECQFHVAFGSTDRRAHSHQFGAVFECAFDLHIVNHLGNAGHDFAFAENGAAKMHQLRN